MTPVTQCTKCGKTLTPQGTGYAPHVCLFVDPEPPETLMASEEMYEKLENDNPYEGCPSYDVKCFINKRIHIIWVNQIELMKKLEEIESKINGNK